MINKIAKTIFSKKLLLLIAVIILSNKGYSQFFYGVQQSFGKNRVVYNQFDWNYYRMPQYDVFFYQRGSRNAQFITANVDRELESLSKFFRLNFDERFQIIVFNTLTDLKQSNLNDQSDQGYNTGGITRLSGNKMFIHGTGKQSDLLLQLRAGITEMLLNYLISGSNFKKSLETYRNMSLPPWFSDGLIMYMSTEKNASIESRIRDGLQTGDLDKFNSYTLDNAQILGYSIWDYISHKYGREVIPNVVFVSYLNRDVKEGFEYVLGASYKQIMKDWLLYYSDIYKIDLKAQIDKLSDEVAKSRNEEKIFNVSISSDRSKAAYTTNKLGLFYVYLLDVKTKKKKKLFRGGFRIPQNEDLSYPIISWHPNNRDIASVLENHGTIFLYLYNTETGEEINRPFASLDKINSISFSEKGDKIVMSAARDGFSDIYVYNIQSKYLENITDDSFDDLQPIFKNSDKEIVFSSNRYGDSIQKSRRFALGKNYFDLYIYDYQSSGIALKKATDTKFVSEFKPQKLGDNYVSYLVFDQKYNQNLYTFKQDSVLSHVDTIVHYRSTFDNFLLSNNNNRSILDYEHQDKLDSRLQVVFHDGRYKIQNKTDIKDSLRLMEGKNIYHLDSITVEDNSYVEEKNSVYEFEIASENREVDLDNYRFESDIYRFFGLNEKGPNNYQLSTKSDSIHPDMEILNRREFDKFKRLYRNIYFATELKTQLDQANDNLDYQVFTGGPVFMNAGFNGLFEITLADVFNDYSLTGGFRTNFQPVAGLSLSPNSEFKLQFDDKKQRWNKSYQFYRRSQYGYDQYGYYSFRIITNKFQYKLSYPLSPVSSLSATASYRRDKEIVLSIDDLSLNYPNVEHDYLTLRIDHTYDNTINYDVNLYRGLRTKVFVELYQGIDLGRNTMVNIGIDARHYTRIHRNIIWANRFASGTSLGSERLAYYLGGVDNSFSPDFDYSLPPSPFVNYGFQTLMTNMRGFSQNVRHGTSFALFNSELRIPFFQYFFNSPLSWSIFRHFQVIPFFDTGTAWTGLSPWSRENSLNKEEIINGPIKVTLDRQKDPLVYGYGVGLRTQIFGYFLRFDWAWGVDTGIRLPRKFYFSLNLDF